MATVEVSPARHYTDAHEANKQVSSSPFTYVATFNLAIFYIFWYFMQCTWSLANYVAWVRFNDTLLDDRPPPQLYLALVILSIGLYFTVGGFLFFRAAKYAKDERDLYFYLSAGIAVMFTFTDVPFWLADVTIVYNFGWIAPVQSATYLLRSLSFLINAFVTWHIYMHRLTKLLHQRIWSRTVDTREIATRQAKASRVRELRKKLKAERKAAKADEEDGGYAMSPRSRGY